MAVKHPLEHLDPGSGFIKIFLRKKRLTICFHFIVCTSSS
ncbi:hypothetical protein ALC57_00844 [Trachymyrmex cornetzi]|uniref:Uncharacterized protein n=1 Tax=Trachymyrmex cornetzi TaxID=471704 RepID=A0A195ENU5_9HYME|nr:hypothetical protein ALC57_00844 [Trachymyrmex cornetzi]